jgi:hypothetical protein
MARERPVRMARRMITPRLPPMPWASQYARAPATPAAGRVNSHAVAIRPATVQRTSAPFLPSPVPMIDPVATWVVDSE